ncbi:MAG: pro-sigmaK processing inhibitor BofA family protein [Bacilli bacterium]
MIIFIIKKIVYALCLLYTINIFISKVGKIIPINIYTIILVTFFGFLAIISLIYLKYYC